MDNKGNYLSYIISITTHNSVTATNPCMKHYVHTVTNAFTVSDSCTVTSAVIEYYAVTVVDHNNIIL